MRISAVRAAATRAKEGAWMRDIPFAGMEGLALKVRPVNNLDYRQRQLELTSAPDLQDKVAGYIVPKDMDRITAILMHETILVDWSGLEDDDGAPVPFDHALAGELIHEPESIFLKAVAWAAMQVHEKGVETLKADAGN